MQILMFCLTIHHLWGLVLGRFPEARVVVYADDVYVKAKLSVALQVLTELKHVLKEDDDLEFNVKPPSSPRVSVRRLSSMSHKVSSTPTTHWVTSVGMFLSSLSVLKVSLVSVCLLCP